MTRVIFYSNVRDKQAALIILVRKALAKRHLITLFAESEQAAQAYSDVLWQQDSTSFLPNVLAPHALANETPVVIDWQDEQLCQDDILVSLTQRQLTVFSRFKQLVELVGIDEHDKALARERFKFYRDRGYEIKHFDEAQLIH
ncbi:MAG: DNA polymerase III subunit chi [Methylophilaceae bacterium]|jgi:DNA polymerase III subunit chi|nr:DNA polymerase III subunit chi [Methylophilaceae bacterium]MDG1454422.1 DNA polymerase III subunit chi [Methylophilaceae bacterium]